MKTLAIALLAGVGALSIGSAKATDIYSTSEYFDPDMVQQVRLVCDEDGRCYRTRRGVRVYRDSYNYYAPRTYHRRVYRDHYYDRPRAGFGIHTPGVSVGVGVDRY